jgi:DNA-binding NarL/FixJ family response regulator
MTPSDPAPHARPVLAVMSDLLFRSKIDAAARAAGLPLRTASSLEQLDRHLAKGSPAIAIVDLECAQVDSSAAIRALRASPGGTAMAIVAFAGHTNATAIAGGRAAGAGIVLARSAFTDGLAALLERAADAERARGPAA